MKNNRLTNDNYSLKGIILCLVFMSLITVSCGSPVQTSTPTIEPTATQIPTPTIAPTPVGSGSGKIYFSGENVSLRNDTLDTKSFDLYSMNVDGTQKINLTNNKDAAITFEEIDISPDGKKLAYVRGRFVRQYDVLTNYYVYEIFMMNADGTGAQKLSTYPQFNGKDSVSELIAEYNPSWSHDGKYIAFVSNRHTFVKGNRNYDGSEIFLMDVNSYEVKKITTSPGYIAHVTWSPDDKQLAFMSNRTGNWNVFIMNSDGSGKAVNITNNKFSNRFPDWSPDGQWIVLHSDMEGNIDLYLIRPDGKDLTKLTNNPAMDATASWSPDKQWIVFYSDRTGIEELFILNVKTKDTIQITSDGQSKAYAEWGK